jgi:1,4-alpha-glucan branching enzyme
MHDTLKYMSFEPIHRKFHHERLTFRMLYAGSENFVLPFSHDEVVYGKGSLLSRMPGDDWKKFANLRLLFGYLYGQTGKKLLFMGGEFGQWNEWNHDSSLDWDRIIEPLNDGLRLWVGDLNRFYRSEPALHERDFDPTGFEWIDCTDSENSVVSFLRRAKSSDDLILSVCNFTPVPRHNYRVGAPRSGVWTEVLNSDAQTYGGSGQGNQGGIEAAPVGTHGRKHSLNLVLPPLCAIFLKSEGPSK